MKKKPYKKKAVPFQAVQYKHDLGQHFLYDTELLHSLVAAVGLQKTDCVLEIGAGAGTLTRELCEAARCVISVEVDNALIPKLRAMEEEYQNLTIIQSDIRKVNIKELPLGDNIKVVANIPYNITSQIFDLFWGTELPVTQMAVMVQKEVADKLIAEKGDKAYGLMSVRCHYYCEPKIIAQIPAAAFTPPPKVDSAFVCMNFRNEKLLSPQEEQLFWKLVKAGYQLRRKTLVNALKSNAAIAGSTLQDVLETLGLPLTTRGEALSVEEWITLTKAIAALV